MIWKMSAWLRAVLVFAWLSVMGMIFFSLTPQDFAESPLIGKINVIIVPVLILFGILYRDELILDRAAETVETRRGLLFAFRRRLWKASFLTAVVHRTVRAGKNRTKDGRNPFGSLRSRSFFGFLVAGRLILLDRACPPGRAKTWLAAFQAFWPFPVEITV